MKTDIRVAVIGAGISGLTFTRALDNRFNVTLFEKANRPGGRVTSKIIGGADFDYGAQFFTAKTEPFQSVVNEMASEGVIDNWQGHFIEFDHTGQCSQRAWDKTPPHYVGIPNMSAVGAWMAKSLDVCYQTHISHIERQVNGWYLYQGDLEFGPFDLLVMTMPPQQVCQLLPAGHSFYPQLSTIKMQSCFALRVVLKEDIDLGFNAALVRDHDISWISKNSSKPKRTGAPSIIVHATNNWADVHLNDDLAQIEKHMLHCLCKITKLSPTAIATSDVKKWVFANARKHSGSHYLLDTESGIAVCGDALIHGRIESAFISAQQLAQVVSQQIKAF
jgi:predicted NAD/FAD-dependent oxidoreductase